jgi:hypothetical protein
MAWPHERARRLKPEKLLWADDGPTVYLVQHDSQEVWLGYWYRLECPTCGPDKGGVEFDVREVPGFAEYPRYDGTTVAEMTAHYHAERRHHAEIIGSALNAGWLPTA